VVGGLKFQTGETFTGVRGAPAPPVFVERKRRNLQKQRAESG